MRSVKMGQLVHFSVNTHSPSGGNIQNADELPRFWVFEDGSDTPIIVASGLTLSRTGRYRGRFHVSPQNGFDPQSFYDVMVSGKVDGITGQLTINYFVENNNFDSLTASGQFVYYADIKFTQDDTNTKDEYTVVWMRNDSPITSGQITSPTIQVIKRSDGTDLIASASMDFVSINVGTLKKDEPSNRATDGEAYIVKIQATIDGQTRTWQRLIGRDS